MSDKPKGKPGRPSLGEFARKSFISMAVTKHIKEIWLKADPEERYLKIADTIRKLKPKQTSENTENGENNI